MLLGALPALTVAVLLTVSFRHVPPLCDGQLYFREAQKVWNVPIRAVNFFPDWLHRGSYVSMGLLGLVYHVGVAPITALRILQLCVFTLAILSFSVICRAVFRGMTMGERCLMTFVFSITPAFLAYFLGVALDFFAFAMLLAYLAALCSRRFLLAPLVGTAFVFCKETGALVYSLTLPAVLVYSIRHVDPGRWLRLAMTRAVFLTPYLLLGLQSLRFPIRDDSVHALAFCRQDTLWSFLLSSNLARGEIQNYLFDLFALNFQWLLLLPIAVGIGVILGRVVTNRSALLANAERVDRPALGLLVVFFLAVLYATTRCPLWNNVKYVIQAMPLWLLLAYWQSLYALPTREWRLSFFTGMAIAFCVSAVRTVDPVSVQFFGSVTIVPHTSKYLCMNSRVRPAWQRGCGQDELMYNLQPFLQPFLPGCVSTADDTAS